MKAYCGGEKVLPGVYLSRSTLEFITIHREGGFLPGEVGVRYWKLSPPVAIMLGPMLALTFVIFVPVMGFVAALAFLGLKGKQSYRSVVGQGAYVALMRWVPGKAYLISKRKSTKTRGINEETETLLKDIEERRKNGDK